MAGESERYNLRAVRDLLLEAFNADELQQLFYFARTRELLDVVHQFREDDSLPVMVHKAVRYCDSRSLLKEMLAEVAAANPRKYGEYELSLRLASPTPAPDAAAEAAEREAQLEQERQAHLEDLYRQAAHRLKERDWTGARGFLIQIEEIEPGYRNTLALVRQVETEEARAEQVDGLMAEGLGHLGAGKWRLASESFRQVLALAPDHADALARLAEADRQGRVAGRLDAGQGHLKAGRWSEAVACFQAALEIEPAHPEASKLLVEAQAQERAERDEATRQAERARQEAAERASREEQARQAERARQEAAERAEREEQARETQLFPFYYEACVAAWKMEWPKAIANFEAVLLRDQNYRDAAARLKEVRDLQQREEKQPPWQRRWYTESQTVQLMGSSIKIRLGPRPPDDVLERMQKLSGAGTSQSQPKAAAAPRPPEWRVAAELHTYPSKVDRAAFSPDGKRLVTPAGIYDEKTARVWEIATGKLIAELHGHSDVVLCAAFSPDGTLVVTAGGDGRAKLWQAATAKVVTELRVHRKVILGMGWQSVQSAAFSPDGKRLATSSSDGKVRLWTVATGEMEAELGGGDQSAVRVDFGPDGRQLITADRDGTARIREVRTGNLVVELRGHTGELRDAAFSPDGKRAVTAGEDGTARIWQVATGKVERLLTVHKSEAVRTVAFHPNGKWVATAAHAARAQVWGVETGKIVAVLPADGGESLSSVAFSRDGKWAVTAGIHGRARIWEVP